MTYARFRTSLLVSTVVLLAVSMIALLAQQGTSQAATGRSVVFGASASSQSEVLTHQNALGKHMEGVRQYKKWDSTLFGRDELWMRDTGHTLYTSIKAQRMGGGHIRFADIAAAAPGSSLYRDMQDIAGQIKAYRAPVFIIFNHEPEASDSLKSGNGPQFAAAFRKFVTVMRSSGVTNAKYVATFTGYGFTRQDSKNVPRNYYPGDAYVDGVAIDVYNWAGCRGDEWKSLAFLIENFRVWGKSHPAEQLQIHEWGSVEDRSNAGRKAAWTRDAEELFKKPGYEQFTALLQWGGRNYDAKCSFDYTTSASSKAAWVAMGHDAKYQGSVN